MVGQLAGQIAVEEFDFPRSPVVAYLYVKERLHVVDENRTRFSLGVDTEHLHAKIRFAITPLLFILVWMFVERIEIDQSKWLT